MLELGEWTEAVEEILHDCEDVGCDHANLLRQVYATLAEGPSHICGAMLPALSRSTLHSLIEAQAFESAAFRLVGRCGYMLSRSGEGSVIASIVLPASESDYSFCARTETAALCGALMTALYEAAGRGT